MEKVRVFGEQESVTELTQSTCPDDEYVGWEMTAIAAKILRAEGAYRCPYDDGFLYLAYSSLHLASQNKETQTASEQIECATHGDGFATFVCEHLMSVVYTRDPVAGNATPEAGHIRYITSSGPPYLNWTVPVTVNDDHGGRAQGFAAIETRGSGQSSSLHAIWEDTRLLLSAASLNPVMLGIRARQLVASARGPWDDL